MLFLSAILVVLFPVTLAAPFTEPSHVARRAPLGSARSGKTIPGQYIVKFKDSASSDAVLSAANGKLKPSHVFKGPFKGFAGHLDAASLDAIRKLPEVEFIEEDAVITLADDLTVPGTGTGTAPRAIVTQAGAPWNLARLSNPTPGSNIYRYDSSAGAGTCSYVIATGIQVTHTQFGGRAIFGANFAGDGSNTDGDGNGHGTNIAGIIGSTSYGVARQTRLIAVKVLNAAGSGTTSGVIQGINFVATDKLTRSCPGGVVPASRWGVVHLLPSTLRFAISSSEMFSWLFLRALITRLLLLPPRTSPSPARLAQRRRRTFALLLPTTVLFSTSK